MIHKPVANRFLTIAIAAGCIALGFFTFGKPLIFDGFSILAFAVIGILFRKDHNILGVCILLIADNLIINTLFVTTTASYIWVVSGYVSTITVLYKFKFDKLIYPVGVTLVVAIACELTWYVTEKPNPQIYFYFLKIAVFISVRQLLMLRHDTTHYLFEEKSDTDNIRLDWYVYKIKALAVWVTLALIIEYLINVSFNPSVLVVYPYYGMVMHGMSIWVMWLVIRESIKLALNKHLAA